MYSLTPHFEMHFARPVIVFPAREMNPIVKQPPMFFVKLLREILAPSYRYFKYFRTEMALIVEALSSLEFIRGFIVST